MRRRSEWGRGKAVGHQQCWKEPLAPQPAQVWASKWNDRAWLSRRAVGVAEQELFMGVLLQQVGQHSRLLLGTTWLGGVHGWSGLVEER